MKKESTCDSPALKVSGALAYSLPASLYPGPKAA